jgi:hypothetical protein
MKGDSKKAQKVTATLPRLKALLHEVYSSVEQATEEKQKSLLVLLKEWQREQKRKHGRKPVQEPVDFAHGARAYRGVIKNIGAGGASIETTGNPAVGDKITLTFTLPGLEKPLKTTGEIVWKDARSFGVKFTGVSFYVEQHLEKIIKSL